MDSPTFAHLDFENTAIPTGRRESVAIGGEQATMELARSLPELIEQLRLLRVEMEKNTKVYDALSSNQQVKSQDSSTPGNSNNRGSGGGMSNSNSSSRSSYHYSMGGGGRQSIFTPFADSSDLDRGSIVSPADAYADAPTTSTRDSSPLELGELAAPPMVFRQPSKRAQEPQRLPRPTVRKPAIVRNVDYTVMWVSGECGISLRNFSSNKIGAQIAVLQQADGVTTGISNCRLGDQLLSVNDDHVETSSFKEIVQKLKTTRRPITLGFRTNPNVATSPVASSSSNTAARSRSSTRFHSVRDSVRASSTRNFFPPPPEDGDDSESTESAARSSGHYAPAPERTNSNGSLKDDTERCVDERTTDTSVRSSTSTLSDEVEVWCKEQEEMHSDIIVLLTETVMRCEKLQQENMDQLQNLMQIAPNLYSSSAAVVSTLSGKTQDRQ